MIIRVKTAPTKEQFRNWVQSLAPNYTAEEIDFQYDRMIYFLSSNKNYISLRGRQEYFFETTLKHKNKRGSGTFAFSCDKAGNVGMGLSYYTYQKGRKK